MQMQIPNVPLGESLTFISYVLLALFALGLVAHLLAAARHIIQAPRRRWFNQAEELAARLARLTESFDRLTGSIKPPEGVASSNVAAASQKASQLLRRAPGGCRIGSWPERAGCDEALDQTVARFLRQAGIPDLGGSRDNQFREPPAMISPQDERLVKAAHSVIEGHLARWNRGLALIKACSPMAGVAGTVSAMTSFVTSAGTTYQSGPGVLLAPLAHAFLTTWIGLVLGIIASVLGVLLAASAKHYRDALAEAAAHGIESLRGFRQAVYRWDEARRQAQDTIHTDSAMDPAQIIETHRPQGEVERDTSPPDSVSER